MYPHWGTFYATHCACFAPTQTGKSYWSEDCSREHLTNGIGFSHWCQDRPHYDRLKDYLTYMNPRNQRVVLLDFSQPEKVLPLGHWLTRDPERISLAIAGAWGARNFENLASYQRIMTTLLSWCGETKRPIQDAYWLIVHKNESRLKAAAQQATKYETKMEMFSWLDVPPGRWNSEFIAPRNRLHPFTASPGLRRFFGTPGDIEIADIVKKNGIVICCTAGMGESGKIANGILLSEFLAAEGRHFLFLDEAGSYLPHNGAHLLDQAAKNGLRATLLFHHLDQFEDRHLMQSILTNCGIKMAGYDLPSKTRHALVDDFFGADMAEPWEREVYENYLTKYEEVEEEETSYHEGTADGVSELGESHTETSGITSRTVRKFVPRQELVRSGVLEFSMEEKRAMYAQRFNRGIGNFLVKFPDDRQYLEVPHLEPYWPSPEGVLEFEETHLKDYISGDSAEPKEIYVTTHRREKGTEDPDSRTLAPQE